MAAGVTWLRLLLTVPLRRASGYVPSIPHARAAGTPTGRSLFSAEMHSENASL